MHVVFRLTQRSTHRARALFVVVVGTPPRTAPRNGQIRAQRFGVGIVVDAGVVADNAGGALVDGPDLQRQAAVGDEGETTGNDKKERHQRPQAIPAPPAQFVAQVVLQGQDPNGRDGEETEEGVARQKHQQEVIEQHEDRHVGDNGALLGAAEGTALVFVVTVVPANTALLLLLFLFVETIGLVFFAVIIVLVLLPTISSLHIVTLMVLMLMALRRLVFFNYCFVVISAIVTPTSTIVGFRLLFQFQLRIAAADALQQHHARLVRGVVPFHLKEDPREKAHGRHPRDDAKDEARPEEFRRRKGLSDPQQHDSSRGGCC